MFAGSGTMGLRAPLDVPEFFRTEGSGPERRAQLAARDLADDDQRSYSSAITVPRPARMARLSIVPGVDLSGVTLNISRATVLVGIGGQGASAGVSILRSGTRQQRDHGRGQPYTSYSLSYVDSLSWVRANTTSSSRRIPSGTYVYRSPGRRDLAFSQPGRGSLPILRLSASTVT